MAGLNRAINARSTFCGAQRSRERLGGLLEFRRRTKTQASFSSEESAVALLFGLIASGQIQLRRIDGYQRLSEVLEHAEVAA